MFKKFIYVTVLLFSSISFANKSNFQDYLGQYNGSYNNTEFSIVLESAEQMTLVHPEYGTCSTNDQYAFLLSDEPTLMSGHNLVVSVYGTVFCSNAWYFLILEMEPNPNLYGDIINSVILIRDNASSDVLRTPALLRKVQ